MRVCRRRRLPSLAERSQPRVAHRRLAGRPPRLVPRAHHVERGSPRAPGDALVEEVRRARHGRAQELRGAPRSLSERPPRSLREILGVVRGGRRREERRGDRGDARFVRVPFRRAPRRRLEHRARGGHRRAPRVRPVRPRVRGDELGDHARRVRDDGDGRRRALVSPVSGVGSSLRRRHAQLVERGIDEFGVQIQNPRPRRGARRAKSDG